MKYVISLGGSVVVPDEIDVEYLKAFKKVILDFIRNNNNRIIIIVGGGKICRKYQKAASEVSRLNSEDVDWLGIHSTRLNAHLLRTIFRDHAHKCVLKNPNEKINLKKKILIAAGWKPGWSTDYDSVLLAKAFGVNTIINISNTDYVYDTDPKKNRNAEVIKEISWRDFRKIIPRKWSPGLNSPFDPVASKEAERLGLRVLIVGKDIINLKNILKNKKFKGTIIS